MTEATSPTNSAQFRIGVYALVFDEEQRVLLAHRRDIDWWNLPGGMEHGETVEEAVRREVREETGLDGGKVSGWGLFEATKARGRADFQLSSDGRYSGDY